MKKLVGLSILVFAAFTYGCASTETTSLKGAPFPIVRLRSEPYSFASASGFDQPARLVIRDLAAWQSAWARIFLRGSVPPVPAIDFSREMVIVAALGMRSSGGYTILVDKATTANGDISILVRSISPGANCGTTAALTQPVDVARVPKSDGTISFVERSEVRAC